MAPHMTPSLYERLAARLDAIPSGYTRTQSGVELRILEKLFTPEQAALAVVMRLLCDPPERIAQRAGVDPEEARALLTQMVQDGLIRAEHGKQGLVYGLIPFVVGVYELNLHRLDAELAALMEQYMQEAGRTSAIYQAPSVHRVIPIEESIPFTLAVHPYENATAMIEAAGAWAVRDCICRVQKKLVGEGCDHPVEVCITFSQTPGAFESDPAARPISKQEALDLLHTARAAGLVHTTGNYRDGHNYICNCCTCSCGVLRGLAEFDVPTAIAHSDFQAVVSDDDCAGCGDCAERCQFDAISLPGGVAVVNTAHCLGCGQCASICPTGALSMERRPRSDREPLPANITAWMLRRGVKRGMGFLDVI